MENKAIQQPRGCGRTKAIWAKACANKERHGLEDVGVDSWKGHLPAKHTVIVTLKLAQAKVKKMIEKSQRETRTA